MEISKIYDKIEDNFSKDCGAIQNNVVIPTEYYDRLNKDLFSSSYSVFRTQIFKLYDKGLNGEKDFFSDIEIKKAKKIDDYILYTLNLFVYQKRKTIKVTFDIVL